MAMNAYHLRKTEVSYELKIRGLSTDGTAGELRKRLSHAFANNVKVDVSAVEELDPDTELESCEEKFLDLSALVEDYEGDSRDREYQRLEARLWHLYLRTERIPVTESEDEEEEHRKSELLRRVKKLLDNFAASGTHKKTLSDKQTSEEVKEPEEVDKMGQENEDDINPVTSKLQEKGPRVTGFEEAKLKEGVMDVRKSHSSREIVQQPQPRTSLREILPGKSPSYPRTKSIPVYKWGLKFAHESKQSIGSFLERVEELRRARGVSEEELFDSAVDLFDGAALVWYRSTHGRINSWEELCREMRIVFQAPDYDLKLQQEIFSRVQGEHEPIDLYIAAMEGLYSRLSEPVSEAVQLKQMYNNLHPQLQDRLAMFEIRSVGELRLMGRKAEVGRRRSLRGTVPFRTAAVLEPDLAYSESHRRRVVSTMQTGTSTGHPTIKCGNCGNFGHRHAICKQSKKRFCYGCGQPDTIRRECDRCTPKNVPGREAAPGV